MGDRRNSLSALLRDTAGTAMTETVIMLPAFIIIWAGIIYIFQGYDTKIQVMQKTRADAWHHATHNCDTAMSPGTSSSESNYDIDTAISGTVGVLGHAYWPDSLREFDASRSGTLDEPEVIGEDTTTLRYEMELMCNEEGQELGDAIHYEAWVLFGLTEIL